MLLVEKRKSKIMLKKQQERFRLHLEEKNSNIWKVIDVQNVE